MVSTCNGMCSKVSKQPWQRRAMWSVEGNSAVSRGRGHAVEVVVKVDGGMRRRTRSFGGGELPLARRLLQTADCRLHCTLAVLVLPTHPLSRLLLKLGPVRLGVQAGRPGHSPRGCCHMHPALRACDIMRDMC